MRGHGSDAAGFSLVEVIIAMFLLGIVAVAILPALWQGIVLSSQQASTATATRYMNSLIDEARATPTCAYLGSIAALPAVTDGNGVSLSASTSSVTGCTPGATATLSITIVGDGRTLATSDALVYIP
jgi:prepilin-type N-terminal cleavage/methylation domain-containing protein